MPRRDGEVFFFGTAMGQSPQTPARAPTSNLAGSRAYRGTTPPRPVPSFRALHKKLPTPLAPLATLPTRGRVGCGAVLPKGEGWLWRCLAKGEGWLWRCLAKGGGLAV